MAVLAMVETGGNQATVFESNRLRDVVGSSQQIASCTTTWLAEAISYETGVQLAWDHDPKRRVLPSAGGVEVVLATSGKAIFVAPQDGVARRLVGALTRRATLEAPGIDLYGAWVDVELDASNAELAAALARLHRLVDVRRTASGRGVQRHRRRPVVATCVATGGAASVRLREPGQGRQGSRPTRMEPVSAATVSRRAAVEEARDRFAALASLDARVGPETSLAESLEAFDALDRVALVHLDTNGLGSRLADPLSLCKPGERVLDALRAFSLGTERAAALAFRDALETVDATVAAARALKVVPILVGGDDTTLLLRGGDAFDFVGQYLAAFEHHTMTDPDVGTRVGRGEPAPLTACAGVVWTKAGYPLSLSMALAAELCDAAKRDVRATELAVSAWNFHDVYDSVALSWDAVLDELLVDAGQSLLCHRPVFVRGSDSSWAAPRPDLESRTHDRLRDRAAVCAAAFGADPDARDGGLTTAQLYSIRSALPLGANVADAQLRLVEERCGAQPALYAEPAAPGGGSLFFDDGVDRRTTPFLDAMTIAANQG